MKKINKELLSNLTVLYVEDEEMIRDEICYFFKKYVKNFHVAKNGLEGLDSYLEYKPDLIITDIQMPKMNGLEMLKKIENKNIPVIITTAYSDIDYFLKAIELNVNKFVIKPIDLMELVFAIQDCVISDHMQDKLFEKENLLRIVDENVLISITDSKGNIIDASHAFCEFVEYTKDELIGKSHSILKHEDTPSHFYEKMWEKITSGNVFKSEIRNRKKNGDIYWANLTITPVFKEDKIVNFTAIRQDITSAKKLELLSIEDDLTKLYNRRYFNKIIDKEIRRVKRDNSILSLLTLDIDYFKKYNDTYGHPQGDKALIEVARVLKESTLRATDYSFRMGGEEFSIIFSGVEIEESLHYSQEIVKKIESLHLEHTTNIASKYLTISAGLIVLNSDELDSVESLYKYSDEALYEAKVKGRNQVVLSKNSK
ncbi:diguanylate cyclase [Poseidonibacter lekithochrous]|uniref:diguanylate cyclase n=1 Tax=Poseidonibacter lekithochrous TaxID=1904463 RepID=UPI0008FC3515|nr:diguanylate cyclase [Poseidonibacter lekithochrous]QKJ22024.1 response regulator receiver-modulated diguanylate cyclase (PAS domain) [Poseidonibacter lekithochrous]